VSVKQAPICPEAAAVPVRASFSLAVSRASVVALARAVFQQAAECAAVQLAAAEVRVSVPPLADDSVPDDCSAVPLADDSPRVGWVDSAGDDYLVALPADDLAPVDCSAAPRADDSPQAGWVDSAGDDYLVALPADDLAPVDCSAAPRADDSVAPDSSCQGAHWVRAGCLDDSPADLQAVDSLAYQVWHSADFPAGQVGQHSAGFQAGCPDEPESPPPVFLAVPS
jgi:hypothetical protein